MVKKTPENAHLQIDQTKNWEQFFEDTVLSNFLHHFIVCHLQSLKKVEDPYSGHLGGLQPIHPDITGDIFSNSWHIYRIY